MKDPLLKKFSGPKVPREAPPPSKWGKAKSGSTFVVRKVGFRNVRGKKLYRLGHHMGPGRPPLFSQHLWTLDELIAAGVEWLSESPFTGVNEEPMDKVEPPAGAVDDKDEE